MLNLPAYPNVSSAADQKRIKILTTTVVQIVLLFLTAILGFPSHGVTAVLLSILLFRSSFFVLGLGHFNTIFTCHSTRTEYSAPGAHLFMEPQRIRDIKASLYDMSMEELQFMSDDLSDLISVLITRQVAVEDAILDRLESAFAKQI